MYAKIFRSLWDGTLGQDYSAWSLFVFMLAHADLDGNVEMTPEAMAARSCMPLHWVKGAITKLEAEDPQSRTKESAGRRIIPLDDRGWGWHIVNYLHYRSLRNEEQRRSDARERMRKIRAANKFPDVRHCSPSFAQEEVDVEVEESTSKSKPTSSLVYQNGHAPPPTDGDFKITIDEARLKMLREQAEQLKSEAVHE